MIGGRRGAVLVRSRCFHGGSVQLLRGDDGGCIGHATAMAADMVMV